MSNSEVLIKAENVSKKFCRRLRRSLWYGVKDLTAEVLGRDGDRDLRRDEFWAIKDVSFEVRRGEVLGIIGANGAGKTTLLRMVNGLIKPDRGRISLKGRVGALIALGAGFNPILTGRENIYINAAVLGLSKRETDKILDDIINFADIHDFIDTPVQHYSSGMHVRLGFSVAAHLQPRVFLIDEILAVGDSGFRTKALNRIRECIANSAVILVSHSMPQIARISTRVMLMQSGTGKMYDDPEIAVKDYLESCERDQKTDEWFCGSNKIGNVEILQTDGSATKLEQDKVILEYGKPFCISTELYIEPEFADLEFHVQFIDGELNTVLVYNSVFQKHEIRNPNSFFKVRIDFKKMILFPGNFSLNISVMDVPSQQILARKWYASPFGIHGSIRGGRYPKIGDIVNISSD